EPFALFACRGIETLAFADVARNLRDLDDATGRILDRRDGDRDLDPPTVLADAFGLVVRHVLAAGDPAQDLLLLREELGWEEHRDRTADRFLRGISEHPLCGWIPRGD